MEKIKYTLGDKYSQVFEFALPRYLRQDSSSRLNKVYVDYPEHWYYDFTGTPIKVLDE